MATQIKFGTSGWRAIVADEFTVANVKRAVTGIARYVAGTGKADPKLVVGRDPRFMGETFVDIAATILESYGITPLVICRTGADAGDCLGGDPAEGRWRDQLYRLAQSGGVQRNQVFDAGWSAGAAGVYQAD